MITQETVLVTGGSGYVAGWTIARLLDTGHTVRATVRSLKKADTIRANIASVAKDISALSFVEADLLAEGGWEEAMQGVSAVMHVASPVMARKGEDTIGVAVQGTLRVLDAATNARVDRVVITSSSLAAYASDERNSVNEADWTDLDTPALGIYTRSKTLAEKAAWDFVRKHPNSPKIATVLPGFVQGPMLGDNASASVGLIGEMLNGKLKALPRVGFGIVDVRDLADLQVRVLDDPRGMGQRWLGSSDFIWLSDIAVVVKEHFGDAASKVSTKTLPNWLVKLVALVNPDVKSFVPDLGKRRAVTSTKTQDRLGWYPRPAREAVIAAAESLLWHKA